MVIANGSPNGVPVVHIAGREISNGIAGRTAYSMTGVVRAARIAAQEHFPSDVVDGGPIGWFICELERSLPSEVTAIPRFVDTLMVLRRRCGCLSQGESDVEIALREALANAIIHGNQENPEEQNLCSLPL